MKLLITGGEGFIARNLHQQLSDDNNIVSCSSSELDLLDSNKVIDFIKDGKFDVVIHTATYDPAPKYSTKDPAKVLENNLRMFFNLARGSGHYGKMLYFGSGAEYGRNYWQVKMDENYFDQHVPDDQYGFSKYIMTKYTQQSSNIYNLRVFSVFGKYEDWSYRFISRACCCALLNLPITIKQNTLYDYLYINDLVQMVRRFIRHSPKHHVYNVCSGKEIKAFDLAEIVKKTSGENIEIKDESKGVCREYSGDNKLLLGEFPDAKFTPIEDAIKQLYDWYRENANIIKRDELI